MSTQQSSQVEAIKVKILEAAYKGQGDIVSLDYVGHFGIGPKEPVGHVRIALADLVKNGLVTEKGKGADDGISFLITASGIAEYETEILNELPPDHHYRGKFR